MEIAIAGGSYLVVLALVVAAARRRSRALWRSARGHEQDGAYVSPDWVEKVLVVLWPGLLAVVAFVVWSVVWFGFYAVG